MQDFRAALRHPAVVMARSHCCEGALCWPGPLRFRGRRRAARAGGRGDKAGAVLRGGVGRIAVVMGAIPCADGAWAVAVGCRVGPVLASMSLRGYSATAQSTVFKSGRVHGSDGCGKTLFLLDRDRARSRNNQFRPVGARSCRDIRKDGMRGVATLRPGCRGPCAVSGRMARPQSEVIGLDKRHAGRSHPELRRKVTASRGHLKARTQGAVLSAQPGIVLAWAPGQPPPAGFAADRIVLCVGNRQAVSVRETGVAVDGRNLAGARPAHRHVSGSALASAPEAAGRNGVFMLRQVCALDCMPLPGLAASQLSYRAM